LSLITLIGLPVPLPLIKGCLFFKHKCLGEEPENNDLLQLFKEMEEYKKQG